MSSTDTFNVICVSWPSNKFLCISLYGRRGCHVTDCRYQLPCSSSVQLS